MKTIYKILPLLICVLISAILVGCGEIPRDEDNNIVGVSDGQIKSIRVDVCRKSDDYPYYISVNEDEYPLSLTEEYYLVVNISSGNIFGYPSYEITFIDYDERYVEITEIEDEDCGGFYKLTGLMECTQIDIVVYLYQDIGQNQTEKISDKVTVSFN